MQALAVFTSYQRCSILPSACWACTVICSGCFMNWALSFDDCPGVGGREQQGLRSLGHWRATVTMSSKKPMSSMRSASSSTRVLSASSVRCWRSGGPSRGRACPPRCAHRAPGSASAAQAARHRTGSRPDVFFGPRQAADPAVTWSASSRVGHSTRPAPAKRRGLSGPAGPAKRGGLAAAGAGLGDEVFASSAGAGWPPGSGSWCSPAAAGSPAWRGSAPAC